jgi:transposase
VLSRDELDQARAMHAKGWTISVIARHLGRDRRTVREHLAGTRQPGVRARQPDPIEPFLDYCRARLTDDPHLAAKTLYGEVATLGYPGAYQTFTRSIRTHDLRPQCPECNATTRRSTSVRIRKNEPLTTPPAQPN